MRASQSVCLSVCLAACQSVSEMQAPVSVWYGVESRRHMSTCLLRPFFASNVLPACSLSRLGMAKNRHSSTGGFSLVHNLWDLAFFMY